MRIFKITHRLFSTAHNADSRLKVSALQLLVAKIPKKPLAFRPAFLDLASV